MPAIKISISMPDDMIETIDGIADDWHTTRSGALKRIYLEWKDRCKKNGNHKEEPAKEPPENA